MLKVKEIFGPTVQGEGTYAGTPAVFVRLSGCNMWNGKPETRATSACPFCDTDFYDGVEMTPEEVIKEVIEKMHGGNVGNYIMVLTGGEPLLQDNRELSALIKLSHIVLQAPVHLETNGTVHSTMADEFNWVCCSPKVPANRLKLDYGVINEMKVLYPHPNTKIIPEEYNGIKGAYPSMHLYVQPISQNTKPALDKVLELGYPWKLSVQTHKYIGVE